MMVLLGHNRDIGEVVEPEDKEGELLGYNRLPDDSSGPSDPKILHCLVTADRNRSLQTTSNAYSPRVGSRTALGVPAIVPV